MTWLSYQPLFNSELTLVVAIEEPESHLHPEAIRQLASVLRDMAKEHQVIITTHSPLLIARNRMDANIIVSKSKAIPAKSIKEVRDSLGVKVDDNLVSAEYVVLVEGETDVTMLSKLFCQYSADFSKSMTEGRVVFDHMGGTGNIAYKISNLRLIVSTPILVVDDDKAGRDCVRKAKTEGGIEDRFVFMCKRSKTPETEFEDIIDPNFYWSQTESEFGAKLDRTLFVSGTGKWSERMHATFDAAGKQWSSSIESNLKNLIAERVKNDPSNAVAHEYVTLIESIASAIAVLFKVD